VRRSNDQEPAQVRDQTRRLRLTAAAVAVVLALGGATMIGYAVGQQQVAPQPTVSAVDAQGIDRGAPPLPVSSLAAPALVVRGPVLPAATPTSIGIPAIGVSSPINLVGLNPDNTMEVPQPGPLYDQAAWYRYSPTPGELGPSVIIGHIDSAEGGPSVFFDLAELQPGQRIDVGRGDGTTAVFEVDSVQSYSKDSFPLLTVYGDTDHAALRLITCGGAFDEARGSYRDNIVVFAHLVDA
jgi:sortase (surface protein transpeptidase)